MKGNRSRIAELKGKRRDYQEKVSRINEWLLKNFNHPDRSKVFTDRSYFECEMNRIDKKIYNLRYGGPELGQANHIEPTSTSAISTR